MAAETVVPVAAPQPTGLSFTQGFLLGQLSVTLLIFCFIKFFIFGEPPPADVRHSERADLRRQRTISHQRALSSSSSLLHHKRSTILRPPPPLTSATILAKTYYNVKGHQPESLDWFNVLIAQTIAQLRADARHDNAVLTSLNNLLNGPTRPDWLGEIRVTEIELGDEFPIFSNCRVIPVEEGGLGMGSPSSREGGGTGESRLQARMDVDLSDVITLGIETTLRLNWPRPKVAVLPVALAVSVVRFSGTLSLSFIPSAQPASSATADDLSDPTSPNSNSTPGPTSSSSHTPTTLAFTFLDDYRLDLSVRSLLGSRSRLQDVPKIAQLIESRLHTWFDERCVEPRFQQIVLPSLWPRKKNTRGGDAAETESSDETKSKGDDSAVLDDDDNADGEAKPNASVRSRSRSFRNASAAAATPASAAGPSGSSSDAAPGTSTSASASANASKAKAQQRQYAPADSLEARMAAEGQKIREAEERAERAERARLARAGNKEEGVRLRSARARGSRSRSRNGQGEGPREGQRDGQRERSARREREWRSMPGSLPGVGTPPP